MTNLKKIWQNTYLGKLLSTDPIFGRVLSFFLVIYIFIHIFRLEMYPMYMFAMFSKEETPRELYHIYKLYDQNQQVKLNDWDFRKYTVFMNTIGQYDAIISNEMTHPEAEAIDKFINRLHLGDTGLKSKLKGSFHFSKAELEDKVGTWISKKLDINPENLRIEKESYHWEKPTPSLTKKVVIYGMD